MGISNGGPACPKPDRLEYLMDSLTAMKLNDGTSNQVDDELQEAVEALDWLHTHLTNRNVYHKRQQLKKKVMLRLMEEKLGKDPDLEEQANRIAEQQLSDYVANKE